LAPKQKAEVQLQQLLVIYPC